MAPKQSAGKSRGGAGGGRGRGRGLASNNAPGKLPKAKAAKAEPASESALPAECESWSCLESLVDDPSYGKLAKSLQAPPKVAVDQRQLCSARGSMGTQLAVSENEFIHLS